MQWQSVAHELELKDEMHFGAANLACERDKVMFTETGYVDLPDQHHLVMILGEDCVIDDILYANPSKRWPNVHVTCKG